jgi:gluconate kinase
MYAQLFFLYSLYAYTCQIIILEIYIVFLYIYLENTIATTSDPITVCEALRQQNDALRQELHDIRRVYIYSYFSIYISKCYKRSNSFNSIQMF